MSPETRRAPKRGEYCAIAQPEMSAEIKKKDGPLQLHMHIVRVGCRAVLVQNNGNFDGLEGEGAEMVGGNVGL